MTRLLALTMGDRYGVGPELVARIIADWHPGTGLVPLVFGDRRVFEHGCAVAGVTPSIETVGHPDAARQGGRPSFVDRSFEAPVGGAGHVSPQAGTEVLETLGEVLRYAQGGAIDGLVYAPLNKQALREAGNMGRDEAEFFSSRLGARASEINMLGDIWTSRVTSHVPLAEVVGLIDRASVRDAIARMYDFLRALNVAAPRLAVAALNPHAGEGGLFGSEEAEIIRPAVEDAAADGIDVEGPFPADTVFPMVLRGSHHAVVTMYHDQGQIALKLHGLGQGVTVMAGLPIPITTAGHGTAFDIAGKGIADSTGLAAAVATCCTMLAADDPA